MKKLKLILMLAVFAFVVFFGGNSLIHATSDDKFCSSCHEWMDPMVKTYSQDKHGGTNKHGLKARCVDCHLPHDTYIGYVFQKSINGVREITHMIFNDAHKMDWEANRKNREKFVYDSGCLSCHENILDINSTNQNINDMHAKYSEFKNTQNISCVSCHKTVGHKNLGKILYEIKNPPVGNWEDEDKK